MKKYPEHKKLDLSQISIDVLKFWQEDKTFEKSISTRDEAKPWVFYEGPPSANGMPGIHHVMARAIKDIFCRFKTLQGYQVKRKAGWDTHGLPIELGVEKSLGITKEDIGNKNSPKYISVEDYNKACRKEVMKYTDKWEEVTAKMGYWVDMSDPYITYDNKYIESVWWLLQNLSKKDLLYKGYTIQPYSPAAGTGLSSHELNQPGCYRDVKDRTAVAMFKVKRDEKSDAFLNKLGVNKDLFGNHLRIIAWTTTPWTLPSNTALAVGKDIDYVLIETVLNESQGLDKVFIIVAKDLYKKYYKKTSNEGLTFDDSDDNFYKGYSHGNNSVDAMEFTYGATSNAVAKGFYINYRLIQNEFKGSDLEGISYEQLLPFVIPKKGTENHFFKVITADFVTTSDGTGIVHIAPTFGVDDWKAAKDNNIFPLTIDLVDSSLEEITRNPFLMPSEDEYSAVKNALLSGSTQSYIEKSEDNLLKEKLGEITWNDLKGLTWNDLNKTTWNDISTFYNKKSLEDPIFKKVNEEEYSKEIEKLREGKKLPLVNKQGKFVEEIKDSIYGFGGEYVKEDYLSDEEKQIEFIKQKRILEANHKIKELKVYLSVDERIVLKLQEEGKLFKKEQYVHSYPHCWRTDKPVLYYPLDSWFIKSTAMKDRMIELNKTINWKPEATGTGRFGNWLENLNDWNLSRSRFWGIPIPIWTSEDGLEQVVIGSAEELKNHIDHSVKKGFMTSNPLEKFVPGNFSKENYETFDLHKPYADTIVLEKNGKQLFREPDLIDVWFDSGAMPYAQVHYPFENKELIDGKKYFPADFIAEGVDQTRGWFFTLHAIATMNFDSVAYKNVVSNGLVLDKNGNKMSKRLGNAVDPFETIEKYGADATRWYMIANAAPWDNLKFDTEGIAEVQRKLFGTLYNTYGFYALYANVDGFVVGEKTQVPVENRVELDKWIISELQSLIEEVTLRYNEFEPHRAARAIETFVDEHLSNWYVRLSRRRFWKGEMSQDKIAAYETLHTCLVTVSQLMSPIAPFFADWMYQNLTLSNQSVHLTQLVTVEKKYQDKALEERMELAQKISSMVLSIRKKENLKVRQPLLRIQIPILDKEYQQKIELVKDLILGEVNVKQIEFVDESKAQIVKNLKLNFKTLGKKCGAHMKAVQAFANENAAKIISGIEKEAKYVVNLKDAEILLEPEDVEIIPVDMPGWKVANSGSLTVALDINLTEELKNEGLAREVVNRIQNLRKDRGFEVTDKILVKIQQNSDLDNAIKNNLSYICSETLTSDLQLVQTIVSTNATTIEVDELISTLISIEKLN